MSRVRRSPHATTTFRAPTAHFPLDDLYIREMSISIVISQLAHVHTPSDASRAAGTRALLSAAISPLRQVITYASRQRTEYGFLLARPPMRSGPE